MTDSFVTRCPHCSTRLRVTYEQISAAAGLVRCGTCLRTFNAHEHLLEGGGTETAVEMDELLIHDDLDLRDLGLDDLNLDEELAQIEAQEQAFSKELLDLSQQIEGDDSHPAASDDEAWAEALLREEEEGVLSSLSVQEKSDETPSPWLPYKESLDFDLDRAAEEPPAALQQSSRANEKAKPKPPLLEQDDFTEAAAVDEPLLPVRAPSRKRTALWALLSVAALLALGGQYVFFQFDSLVRQERYRSLFTTVCSAVGCKVPSQIDLSQIRSSNLLVHSHPWFSGALMVDAILYNHASFAQPFPLLELEFSNLAGRPVASRRFTPSQYLAGDMQGKLQMPSQVPIHIALEIQDPGKEAVNYRLSILPPE